jgi:hypothetical protein
MNHKLVDGLWFKYSVFKDRDGNFSLLDFSAFYLQLAYHHLATAPGNLLAWCSLGKKGMAYDPWAVIKCW